MMQKNIAILTAVALLLAACGSAPKTAYYWQDYSPTVYHRLKNDDTAGEQIEKMQKYFKNAEQKQMAAAPGAHAHMGLLLLDAGQTAAALQHFSAEKQQFPESAVFMDFLMDSKKEGADK